MSIHVISVGGSLIVPNEIDYKFLRSFKEFILNRIKKGEKFILITGGGKTCRIYQDAASKVTTIDDEEKDWLGIHSTRLNGHLLRTIFKEYAHPKVIKNYTEDLSQMNDSFEESILVGAGWRPGRSSDFCAVELAKKFNAVDVINLSNIEYVYSEDPKKNPNATKYEKLSWDEFRKIVGNEWSPGMNAPFDPVASKTSQELNLSVAIINGKDLESIGNYLDNKPFKGTIIS